MECLTLFSGDLLSPSLISTMFEGEQMVPSFRECAVDVACIGNHDLDFGIGRMTEILQKTTKANGGSTEWVCSNLFPADEGDDEDGCFGFMRKWTVVERGSLRIGLMGIVEQ